MSIILITLSEGVCVDIFKGRDGLFTKEFRSEAWQTDDKSGIDQTVGALQIAVEMKIAVMQVIQTRQQVPDQRKLEEREKRFLKQATRFNKF